MAHIEPLEPHAWFRAIRNLLDQAASAASSEQERLVRHTFHLCQLTPGPLKDFVRAELEEDELESLLASGALERAATAIVGSPMILEVVRHEGWMFEARVRLPGQREASSCKSGEVAAGIVAAWAQCLVDLEERARVLSDTRTAQVPPTAQCELRPELS